MRFFLQNQHFASSQAQEAKFERFAEQARGFLETTSEFFVTPIGDDWSTLEQKGSRFGAFVVTKFLMKGGCRFSAIPEFFDPARLTPVLVSVPTGSVMTNVYFFIGSQAG